MRKLIAVIGLGVMLLGACGGGSDNKTDNASGSSDTTVTTAASGASSGGSFGEICAAKSGLSAPNPADFTGANAANAFKTIKENLDKAKSTAPSEIRADVVILVDTSKPYFELLAAHNYNFMEMAQDASAQQKLQAISAKFQDAKVKAAQEHVQAWVQAHCS